MSGLPPSLAIDALARAYRERQLCPLDLIDALSERIGASPSNAVWINLTPRARLIELGAALGQRDPASLPLYGIPFAIKDNIDLAGTPTTAACPDFAYLPAESAHVVERLIAAGALPIGKTNLDQFATGLTGTRSPYGICRNSFDARYIAGGSSSGSALAVASGLTSFALGTDTAGSGRIPAAFNNLVGLKPTLGRLSPRGVVPACRTLDTVSILAGDAADAARVCRVAEGFDAAEPYSRHAGHAPRPMLAGTPFRFGVPRPEQLQFFDNQDYAALFEAAAARLQRLGGQPVQIDFAPFRAAAELLYGGPWVAERYVVVEALLAARPEALQPVTRQIIQGGARPSAADAFRAQYELQRLRRASEYTWREIDVLLTPTAGTIYRVDEIESNPIELNTRLGYYTNFVNLMDLTAVALPGGFTPAGLPFGVTLVAQAWSDYPLLELAAQLHASLPAGRGGLPVPLPAERFDWRGKLEAIPVAVCGAHLQGLPLNHQLTERGAVLLERTHTAPLYRLLALPGGPPWRPGLQRVADQGTRIEVEVWAVPAAAFGSFVAGIPAPLGIGKLTLSDGREVCGFICEGIGLAGADDISAYGGWRSYLASRG